MSRSSSARPHTRRPRWRSDGANLLDVCGSLTVRLLGGLCRRRDRGAPGLDAIRYPFPRAEFNPRRRCTDRAGHLPGSRSRRGRSWTSRSRSRRAGRSSTGTSTPRTRTAETRSASTPSSSTRSGPMRARAADPVRLPVSVPASMTLPRRCSSSRARWRAARSRPPWAAIRRLGSTSPSRRASIWTTCNCEEHRPSDLVQRPRGQVLHPPGRWNRQRLHPRRRRATPGVPDPTLIRRPKGGRAGTARGSRLDPDRTVDRAHPGVNASSTVLIAVAPPRRCLSLDRRPSAASVRDIAQHSARDLPVCGARPHSA